MAIVSVLIQIAVAVAVSLIAKAIQKKPKSETQSADFEQVVKRRLSTGQPLEILVGRRIVGGVGFFDDAYSTNNELAVSVSVLSAKPCTQFHTLFMDGEPVTLAGDPTTGERLVTSHFLGKNDVPRAKLRVFLGDDNSGLGSYLAGKFPGKFTANDNFGDYCVAILECENTNDDLGNENDPEDQRNKNFIPFQNFPDFKLELSGVKICDPRIAGSVYGDESTYVYSNNSRLVDAQYDFGWYSGVGAGRSLIVGNGYDVEVMDIEQIKSQATHCDNEGYTCSGLIRSGKNDDQDEIWKTYNADRIEHAASIFSVAESGREVSETIDMSEFLGAYVSFYDPNGFSTEVMNFIQTKYAEPDEYYSEKDLPVYSNADWIADDNHIPRGMSLPLLFVTDKVQAAKLQKQEIFISRAAATCTITDLPYGHIRIKVGSIVTLVNSDVEDVNDRQWVVKSRGQTERGDVTLNLREYAGQVAFDFDETTEFVSPEIQVPVARPWPWREPFEYPVTDVRTLAITNSYTSGLTLSGSDMGSDAEINVSAHTRVYADAVKYPSVSFAAQTITGLNYDTVYLVYYDDDELKGLQSDGVTEITLLSTTVAADAYANDTNPYRHFVGSIKTPASGGGGTSGGGSNPVSTPDPDPVNPGQQYP
jgi:hypothetical protein